MFAHTKDEEASDSESTSEEEVKKKLDARKAAEEKKQFDALKEAKEKKRVEKLAHSLRAIVLDPESQGAIALNALMEYNETCGKKVKEYEVLQKERQKYQKLMKEALLGAMKQALDIVATSADEEFEDAVEEEIAATAYMKFSQKEFDAAVEAKVDAKVEAEVKKKTKKLKKELKNRIKHARDALTYGTNKTVVAFVHTPLTNLFLPLRM